MVTLRTYSCLVFGCLYALLSLSLRFSSAVDTRGSYPPTTACSTATANLHYTDFLSLGSAIDLTAGISGLDVHSLSLKRTSLKPLSIGLAIHAVDTCLNLFGNDPSPIEPNNDSGVSVSTPVSAIADRLSLGFWSLDRSKGRETASRIPFDCVPHRYMPTYCA